MKTITIVDYGVGNLLSVQRALEKCGASVELTEDPGRLEAADRLVLPGVGAFGDAMAALRSKGLIEAILGFSRTQRPFLGICLGMQMMLEVSQEFGENQGLGLIPGSVVPIEPTGLDGKPHLIPHIGWAGVEPPPGSDWTGSIFDGLIPGSTVYFVHSFVARPASAQNYLAEATYNGRRITAAIQRGPLYGVQFHPEKSGKNGLAILQKFCSV